MSRIWITGKDLDGPYDGERITAPNIEEAKRIAMGLGLIVIGELKCEVEDASPGKVIEAMRAAGAPESEVEKALDALREKRREMDAAMPSPEPRCGNCGSTAKDMIHGRTIEKREMTADIKKFPADVARFEKDGGLYCTMCWFTISGE